MRWLPIAVVAVSLLPWTAYAADGRPTWVFLRDKGVAGEDLVAALDRRAEGLAARTLERRLRVRQDAGLDGRDADLFAPYLAGVIATGAVMRASSRWLNALSVVATAEQLADIATLPYVVGVQPVASRDRPFRSVRIPDIASRSTTDSSGETDASHGVAEEQLALIGIPDLHDCGLDGTGVVVGVQDTGFSLEHEAFAQLDVVDQHDFINDDDETADETGDPAGQHDHGTWVLSLLAGWDPGDYKGVAPRISVLLSKVEDTSQEQPIEEDWWIEGLEWLEAAGADVVTSSLGFIDWYEPGDLDGQTALTSQAAKVALDNGLIVVNSAGNSGPDPTSIIAPADVDGVIAVGAVDVDGGIADFSSRGPTADERIKPDVCAVGVDNWIVDRATTDGYEQANGTSFAAPMVAGLVALLLQAFPDLTPAQMHELLTSTASQASNPDNDFGFGIPSGTDAAGLYCTCWDVDEDGFYDEACGGTDCDDDNPDANPDATEICNGFDDDCDGQLAADEEDADGDSFWACDDDCDDDDDEIHPDAEEICDNGLDDDCDDLSDTEDPDCPAPLPEATVDSDGSCGCRLSRRSSAPLAALGLLALWAAAEARRRRAAPAR